MVKGHYKRFAPPQEMLDRSHVWKLFNDIMDGLFEEEKKWGFVKQEGIGAYSFDTIRRRSPVINVATLLRFEDSIRTAKIQFEKSLIDRFHCTDIHEMEEALALYRKTKEGKQ